MRLRFSAGLGPDFGAFIAFVRARTRRLVCWLWLEVTYHDGKPFVQPGWDMGVRRWMLGSLSFTSVDGSFEK